jgi:two-component system LytT family response regulator
MLRVILVDDEAPARRYLRRLLDAVPDVEIAGEAATQQEALALIRSARPHAVLLDIELTRGTGFDILHGLDTAPAIIFVTAHADHAARAFDVAALDYLLKPVGMPRLEKALARLREFVGETVTVPTPAAPSAPAYLIARTRQHTRPIRLDTLSALVAQGDYVQLCCTDGSTELMHTALSRLLPRLPAPPFFQASRSIVVNLDHVARLRGDGKRHVEFIERAAPVELGLTAFQRLRRELERRAAAATGPAGAGGPVPITAS